MKMIITFDDSLKEDILKALDKSVDKEGYIVEKSFPEQKVLSPDGEEVHINDFARITKGSEIFIKKDLPSLVAFAKKV